MLFALPSLALAADLTRMPDALQVEGGFVYHGSMVNGDLLESGESVAERQVQQHGMLIQVGFAPAKGVSFHIAADVTAAWNHQFTNHRRMFLEPVDGGGSYINSPEITDAPVEIGGSGLNGIWLGASLAPFSEAYQKFHRISWKLDLGVRTGSKKSNRWTVRNGGRGGAPGGIGLRVAGAFSRRTGASEPYIRLLYQNEGRVEVDVVDENGLGGPLTLKPASIVDLRGGCEIHATETDQVSIDLWMGATYTTPEVLPSGVLLPHVIDSAKVIGVTHSDTLTARAGLGFHVQFADFLRASVGAHGIYTVPHTQEHVFNVGTSADTLGLGWTTKLVGTFGVSE